MYLTPLITVPATIFWRAKNFKLRETWDFLASRLGQFAIFVMLLTWGWVWDFSRVKDGVCQLNGYSCQRSGRAIAFLFGAIAVSSIKIGRTWHWSVGLFYLYLCMGWVYVGAPVQGTDELLMITAALFLIPEINARVSIFVFESIILLTSVAHCLVAILNIYGIFPFLKVVIPLYAVGKIPIGLMGQETLLAPYLVYALAIALCRLVASKRRDERQLYALIAGLNLAIVIACQSMMGFLSLASIVPVFALLYGDVWLFILTIIGGGVAAATLYYAKPGLAGFSGRLAPWKDAWELSKFHPIMGYGPGSWFETAKEIKKLRQLSYGWYQLHSEPLQGYFQFGAIGMSLVVTCLLKATAAIRNLDRALIPSVCGLAVFGVNSLGNFTFRVVPLGPLFAYCLYTVISASRNTPPASAP